MNTRKPNRLKEFDYSSNGAYFVTICTKDKKCVLSKIVGEGFHALPQIEPTAIGVEIERTIHYLNNKLQNANISEYVVMPNHIHMIIAIYNPPGVATGGRGSPPLQEIVKRFKTFTTKQYGSILWQRSFHDHIIRNDDDYLLHLQYIENNPAKWLLGEDEYFTA